MSLYFLWYKTSNRKDESRSAGSLSWNSLVCFVLFFLVGSLNQKVLIFLILKFPCYMTPPTTPPPPQPDSVFSSGVIVELRRAVLAYRLLFAVERWISPGWPTSRCVHDESGDVVSLVHRSPSRDPAAPLFNGSTPLCPRTNNNTQLSLGCDQIWHKAKNASWIMNYWFMNYLNGLFVVKYST